MSNCVKRVNPSSSDSNHKPAAAASMGRAVGAPSLQNSHGPVGNSLPPLAAAASSINDCAVCGDFRNGGNRVPVEEFAGVHGRDEAYALSRGRKNLYVPLCNACHAELEDFVQSFVTPEELYGLEPVLGGNYE